MRESFDRYSKGDRLKASHVNTTSRVARRTAVRGSGSYTSGRSSVGDYTTGLPPFIQHLVSVVNAVEDADGRYNVKIRYYDVTTDSWAMSSEQYVMDARDTGGSFADGDKLVAFFHEQSGFFVPLGVTASIILRIGKADGSIAAGAVDGTVTLWRDGEATTDELNDVHHDWITGNAAVPDGGEVVVGWFSEENVWRIIGANCA
jgi:hypothetical protein